MIKKGLSFLFILIIWVSMGFGQTPTPWFDPTEHYKNIQKKLSELESTGNPAQDAWNRELIYWGKEPNSNSPNTFTEEDLCSGRVLINRSTFPMRYHTPGAPSWLDAYTPKPIMIAQASTPTPRPTNTPAPTPTPYVGCYLLINATPHWLTVVVPDATVAIKLKTATRVGDCVGYKPLTATLGSREGPSRSIGVIRYPNIDSHHAHLLTLDLVWEAFAGIDLLDGSVITQSTPVYSRRYQLPSNRINQAIGRGASNAVSVNSNNAQFLGSLVEQATADHIPATPP
jgi:hypothetical protein